MNAWKFKDYKFCVFVKTPLLEKKSEEDVLKGGLMIQDGHFHPDVNRIA